MEMNPPPPQKSNIHLVAVQPTDFLIKQRRTIAREADILSLVAPRFGQSNLVLDRGGQEDQAEWWGSATCYSLVLRKAPTIKGFLGKSAAAKAITFSHNADTRYQSDIFKRYSSPASSQGRTAPRQSSVPSPTGKGVHSASRSSSVFCASFSGLSSTTFPEDACDASALVVFGVPCRS